MTYPHVYSLPTAAASQVDAPTNGDGGRLFWDVTANALGLKRRDGTAGTLTGFVNGVQDIGKGMLSWTLDNGVGTTTTFLKYQPTEANSAPWLEGTLEVTNTGSARHNHTWTMGWNLNPNGGRLNTGSETALGFSFEQYYNPGLGHEFMEWHLLYLTNADVQLRPISCSMRRDDNFLTDTFNCDQFVVAKTAGATACINIACSSDQGDGQQLFGDVGHPFITIYGWNNSIYAYGRKADASTVGLFYVDSSNKFRVDPSALGTQFGGTVGFNGTVPPAKPAVTGSRGANAALASLLTALAATGLITDSTSA